MLFFSLSLSLWHCVYFSMSVSVCVLRAGSRALLSLGRPLPQRDAKAHWPVCQNQRCMGDSSRVTATHKALGQRPVRGGLDGYGPATVLNNNRPEREMEWGRSECGVTLQMSECVSQYIYGSSRFNTCSALTKAFVPKKHTTQLAISKQRWSDNQIYSCCTKSRLFHYTVHHNREV